MVCHTRGNTWIKGMRFVVLTVVKMSMLLLQTDTFSEEHTAFILHRV